MQNRGPQTPSPRPLTRVLTRRQIGNQFEQRATSYLESRGYTIVDRNRIYPWGEIDIIAEEHVPHPLQGNVRTLVFVEVRGITDGAWITPIESIGPKKAARLKRAIETYLLYYKGPAANVRIDLISIEGDAIPEHFPNFIVFS